MNDIATYLAPAFIAAAVFLLIVGAGIVTMVHLRYRTPAERAEAAGGLRVAGVSLLAVALVMLAVFELSLPAFGRWLRVVPGAVMADSVLFLVAARWVARPLTHSRTP